MPPSQLRHEINLEVEDGTEGDALLPVLTPLKGEARSRRHRVLHRVLELDYRARIGLVAILVFIGLVVFRTHGWAGPRCPGYRQVGEVRTTAGGLAIDLELGGQACHLYGSDLAQAVLEVTYETPTRLRVHVRDVHGGQAQIPANILPREESRGISAEDSAFTFEYAASPFSFVVRRKSNGDVLFDTSNSPLVFEDTYLQIGSTLPRDANLYGLGEVQSTSGFRRDPRHTTQALFNIDYPVRPDTNLYGSHPVYLDHRLGADGTASTHAVFFANMHPMDAMLRDRSIEYRALGGTFDFVFLAGPGPQDAIRQYVDYIGKPQMQAMWTLGFHMCKWGYKNVSELRTVTEKMRSAKIPQDTQWSDIDYMDKYMDFTLDPTHFPQDELANFVEDLHTRGQHFVPIIDVGIPVGDTDTYVRGRELDVYIKDREGKDFIGRVWPGRTVYPDFTSTNTQFWWNEAHANLSRQLDFDGLWNDMNEPANFCNGPCTDKDGNNWRRAKREHTFLEASRANNDEPRYPVHSGNGLFSAHSFPFWAKYANGRIDMQMHNIYGISETQATNVAMRKLRPTRRPFILSRSTFVGSGRSAAHWFGDNISSWAQLWMSLQAVLQFQLYGIPLVGADMCGFMKNTTEELCNRWMQLGALVYPFARNHNVLGAADQEPYLWPSVAEASRTALTIRYKLMPFWYTLLHDAATTGSPMVRALWWEWPSDQTLYDVDRQVMIGAALLVTPVLEPGASSVTGFLPGSAQDKSEIWRDFYTLERVVPGADGKATFAAPLGHTPMHIRGGHILLQHDRPGLTTRESLQSSPYSILASLDADDAARGESYADDGETLDPASVRTTRFVIRPGSQCLDMTTEGSWAILSKLDRVTVLGVPNKPIAVTLNGRPVEQRWIAHDPSIAWLEIVSLETDLTKNFSLCWQ